MKNEMNQNTQKNMRYCGRWIAIMLAVSLFTVSIPMDVQAAPSVSNPEKSAAEQSDQASNKTASEIEAALDQLGVSENDGAANEPSEIELAPELIEDEPALDKAEGTVGLRLKSVFSADQSNNSYKMYYSSTYTFETYVNKSGLVDPIVELRIPKTAKVTLCDSDKIGSNLKGEPEDYIDGDTRVVRYHFNTEKPELTFSTVAMPDSQTTLDAVDWDVVVRLFDGNVKKDEKKETLRVFNPSLQTGYLYTSTSGTVDNYENKDIIEYPMFNFYRSATTPSSSTYCAPYKYEGASIVFYPDDTADVGYLKDGAFKPFQNNEKLTLKETIGGVEKETGSVVYKSSYGSLGKPALVYTLTGEHYFCRNASFSPRQEYAGSIRYRYTKSKIDADLSGSTTSKTYYQNMAGEIKVAAGGNEYTIYSRNSYSSAGYVTIKKYRFRDYFYLDYSYYREAPAYIWKNSGYFSYGIINSTGAGASDVVVKSEIPKEAWVDKIDLNLSNTSSYLPSEAYIVSYKVKVNGVERSVTGSEIKMDSDNKTFTVPEGRITEITIRYASIPNGCYSDNLCKFIDSAIAEECLYSESDMYFKTQLLSGKLSGHPELTDTGSEDFGPFDVSRDRQQYKIKYRVSTGMSLTPNGSFVQCADNIKMTLSFTTDSVSAEKEKYKNPVFYVLIPSVYELVNYENPTGWTTPVEYHSTQIHIGEDIAQKYGSSVKEGDYRLYEIHYSGEQPAGSKSLNMNLRVRYNVPSSIPKGYCMFYMKQDNPFYYGSMTDYLQLTGSEEKQLIGYLASYQIVTVRKLTELVLQGDIADAGSTFWKDQVTVAANEQARYRVTVFNNQGSSDAIEKMVIDIPMPRKGKSHEVRDEVYTNDWDAILTGEAELIGESLEGAAVTYSYDGGSTYESSFDVSRQKQITNVRIAMADGKHLSDGDQLEIVIPIRANLRTASVFQAKSYMAADLKYRYSDVDREAQTTLCTMTAGNPALTGRVYQDYNNNQTLDEDENENPVAYDLVLYRGSASADPSALVKMKEVQTDETGEFSFEDVIDSPGAYTVVLFKDEKEIFSLPGGQDEWKINGNQATYEFNLASNGTMPSPLAVGIIGPRRLVVSNVSDNDIILRGEERQMDVAVYPPLLASETLTFTSSDESVATVDSTGLITYVSDGDVVITVSAPAYAGLVGEIVSKEFHIKCDHYPVQYQDETGTYQNSRTLQNAADSVAPGGRIRLLEDIAILSDVSFRNDTYLNGAGKKLYTNNHTLIVAGGATLTMDDPSLSVIVDMQNPDIETAAIYPDENGTVCGIKVEEGAELKLNGAHITGADVAVMVRGALTLGSHNRIEGSLADIWLGQDSLITFTDNMDAMQRFTVYKENADLGRTLLSEPDADNYSSSFTSVQQGYEVAYGSDKKLHLRRDVKIVPTKGQGKTVGDPEPVLTYTASPSVSLNGILGREPGEEAGSYAYTLGTLALSEQQKDDFKLVLAAEDSFVIESAEKYYKVVYKVGKDVTGKTPKEATYKQHQAFKLPKATFKKKGYTFAGWKNNGRLYKAGATFHMPDHDLTFVAQWSPVKAPEPSPRPPQDAPIVLNPGRLDAVPKTGEQPLPVSPISLMTDIWNGTADGEEEEKKKLE